MISAIAKRLSFPAGLTALLLVKALLLILLVASGYIPLAPDEAQYWSWSQKLDFGYYSKPPLIALQIWLTTHLLGNSELGVRLGAILIGTLIPLAIFKLAKSSGASEGSSTTAALLAACSPFGLYLSLAATTDAGALLFFTLALAHLLEVGIGNKSLNFSYLGILVALSALFKWTAYLLWPTALLLLLFLPALRTARLLYSLLISLLALLPSLYWNVGHDFATFRHVGEAVVEKRSGGNFFDFFAAQAALVTPIFFFYFLKASFEKKNLSQKALLIMASGLYIYMGLALFKKMQPNWALFFLPAVIVLAADRLRSARWKAIGLLLPIVGLLVTFLIPLSQQKGWSPGVPYKANAFRQSMGASRLSGLLEHLGYNPASDFLFADSYQTTSLLAFYGSRPHRNLLWEPKSMILPVGERSRKLTYLADIGDPALRDADGQKGDLWPQMKLGRALQDAYFFNLSGRRRNQFSYGPQLSEDNRGRGIFCLIENCSMDSESGYREHNQSKLEGYFDKVEYLGAYSLFEVSGEPVKLAFFFACSGYNGKLPEKSSDY